VPMLSRDSI